MHCHDLGDHLGCYPNNSARTPALDRFAQEGVVFEQYFAAAPTCSPSRASTLSGLLPHRHGLIALASGGHWEIRTDIPTLPRILKEAGYQTGSFGIWHINMSPDVHGVDHFDTVAQSDVATPNAIEFLKNRDTNRSFFLMVGFEEPHRPFAPRGGERLDPDKVIVPPYLLDCPEMRQEMVNFYDMVNFADLWAGQILDFIKAEGLDENTLCIFTSDHGIGMPLAKGTLYDPGLKIPLLIRWPGQVEGGRRCNDLTSNIDLLPTVLQAVGLQKHTPADLDGHSLWPFVQEGQRVTHERVFAEQTWHDFYEPIRSIRTSRYKLIRNFEPGPGLQLAADILYTDAAKAMRQQLLHHPRPATELYDLGSDPIERNNLANRADKATLTKDLRHELNAFLSATHDPILKGVVPAPSGYWEHFLAKPSRPGGLPLHEESESWTTTRWPFGATEHDCTN